MISLSPRFLFLAALCAAAAMPSLVLVTDARAVDIGARHSDPSPVSHQISPSLAKGKGKDRGDDKNESKSKGVDKGKGEDESASGSINLLSPLSLILPDILFGDDEDVKTQKNDESKNIDRRHTRALLASGGEPQDSPDQLVDVHIGLKEDTVPYLGALRKNSTQDPDHHRERGVQAAFNLEKRRHHQDRLDLETRVVSRIYGKQSLKGFDRTARSSADVWDPLDPFLQIGDIQIGDKRGAHYYHHYDHDKVVVAGDDDDVHIHEHRSPRHHHHHGPYRVSEGKIDVLGSNDDVHIHERHAGLTKGNSDGGLYQKRSDSVDDTSASGVPGTVDIMVSGTATERLASLVLSSVPDNSTANSTSSTNTTQAASPFILDASNTTQTQFYLVALPSESPISALEASSSSNGGPSSSDVRVTLQVPVFVPLEAAMRPYCATFDPNPPAPAPLAMQRCFSDMESSAGNSSDPSMHKSQIFVYDPVSGSIRPEWFDTSSNSTGTDSPDTSSNSTSGPTGSQLDFRIPNSVKDVTSANYTTPSAPVSGGASSPRNVTLVFTPATPAVEDDPELATFGPTGSSDNSDSEADPATPSSESSDTTDSSNAAADDSPVTAAGDDADASNVGASATSDASSGNATSTDSSLAVPTGDISDESIESSEQADAEPTTSSVSATSSATDVMDSGATASTDPDATTSSTSPDDSIAAAPTPPPSPGVGCDRDV
ncbi:hypothetical protein M0805_001417 [Coniferiporia weirii]|nr:hypothetical protein M0805_001417 [Coniferiporia weirii]